MDYISRQVYPIGHASNLSKSLNKGAIGRICLPPLIELRIPIEKNDQFFIDQNLPIVLARGRGPNHGGQVATGEETIFDITNTGSVL